MLSILKNKDSVATELLIRFEVEYERFKDELDFLQQDVKNEMPGESGDDEGFEEEEKY